MSKKIKIASLALALALGLTATGCGGKDVLDGESIPSVIKTSNELTYHCSDQGFEDFINDYYSRHVRNGDDAIGSVQIGLGETYQKLWETDSLVWFDSTLDGLGDYDGMANIKTYLSNLDVDRLGNVYSSPNSALVGTVGTAWMGQGWPFPVYNRPEDRGIVAYGVEFNNTDNGSWTVDGASGVVDGKGFMTFSYAGGRNSVLELQSPSFCKHTETYVFEGYDTSIYGPFVEVDLRLEDLNSSSGFNHSTIDDWNFCWKTKETGDEWNKVSQRKFAANPIEPTNYTVFKTYLPMYLDSNWHGKHVTDIKIEIVPKAGEKLNLNGSVNYLRMMCDTRNSTNAGNYIGALEKYVMYNNDTEFLKSQITKARKAILFQMYHLDGIHGLVNLSYLQGHSLSSNGGYITQNGFWDIYATGNRNAEANSYFYIALKSLARLERYLTDSGIEVTEVASVSHPYYNQIGNQDIVYDFYPDQLDALAEEVKINMCKNVADGGFWNPETGRFAWALYDEDPIVGFEGGAMDYGHTELNLRLMYEGIATEEQSASIMSWLNGERTVAGDNSDAKGKDGIYMYEFAPRVTTKHNQVDYGLIWQENPWSVSCQDGGAIMYVTFFDLMARNGFAGANDCFNRLKEIQSWYEDVKSFGGEGKAFYDGYYFEKRKDYGAKYKLQGGTNGNGAIGLGDEFYESALLYSSIPYAFFGLKAEQYKTLTIAPNLPDGLEYFALENLMYSGIKYDCYVTNNKVVVSGIRGTTSGENIKIKFKKTKENHKVKINGKETSDFKVEGDYVIVKVPMSHLIVTVE